METKKVLIIDSLPGTINFGNVLKNSNIQIWIARDEKEALECFKYSEVDAIVIEPLLAGPALLNNVLKATARFKKTTKVILYSFVSQSDLLEQGFPGDYPYFRKPTFSQEIINEINKN